jgi:membrane protein implicated in regulation of membrane protease activity
VDREFKKLINLAGAFFLLSFVSAWFGSSLLSLYAVLHIYAVDVPTWLLSTSATLLVSSAASYALYRRFKRLAVEERTRECIAKQYNKIATEIRRLKEELISKELLSAD